MSALEWLDAVRADLAAADLPWDETWSEYGSTVHTTDGYTVEEGGDADANLIASAPDRLDRMERALRGVLDLAEAVNAAAIIPTSAPIMNAGYRAALGDVVTAIKEELGDE